jgi:hypothetical protein
MMGSIMRPSPITKRGLLRMKTLILKPIADLYKHLGDTTKERKYLRRYKMLRDSLMLLMPLNVLLCWVALYKKLRSKISKRLSTSL